MVGLLGGHVSIPTLFLTAATILAALAVVMVFFASLRRVYPGFREWALGQVAGAIGLVLLALRGKVPDLISVLLANLAILLYSAFAVRGFRRFYALPKVRGLSADVILVAIAMGLLTWFTWIDPDVRARIVVFGVVAGILHAYAGLAPLAAKEARANRVQRALSAAYAVIALVYLFRGARSLVAGPMVGLADDPTLVVQVLTAVASQVAITCGLIYLNFDRAGAEIAEKECRLRLAQDAARAGSWETELTTGRTFWSEGLWASTGSPRVRVSRRSTRGWASSTQRIARR